MQGNTTNDQRLYRCRYRAEFAQTRELEHPKQVYVAESRTTAALDRWIATLFDEDRSTRRTRSSPRNGGLAETPKHGTSPAEIRALLDEVRGALGSGDGATKAELHAAHGIRMTSHASDEVVDLVAAPARGALKSVSEGGLEPPRPCGH
jgi:hypothetical protein